MTSPGAQPPCVSLTLEAETAYVGSSLSASGSKAKEHQRADQIRLPATATAAGLAEQAPSVNKLRCFSWRERTLTLGMLGLGSFNTRSQRLA